MSVASKPAGRKLSERAHDVLWTVGLLLLMLGVSALLAELMIDTTDVLMICFLMVIMVARMTTGYWYGIAAALAGVLVVNFFFTYPFSEFNFTITGYPITFACLLLASVITSALTTRVKAQAQEQCRMEAERQQAMLDARTEQMRGNLLRAVSHDLRTPLTGIYGSAATLLETGDQLSGERRQQLLEDVRENAAWLIRMVENLLSVTRIGQDPSSLNKSPEAAEEIVGAAVANLRKSFPYAAISVEAPQELLMIPMDGTLIQQVLINLLENAVKYSQSDAPVRVSVRREEKNALFTVSDSGVGLSRERLAHAFDGAVPEEGGSDARRGMGIGLPICKSIVNAHGGAIRAENLREGGCRFSFTLPLDA